VSAVVPPPVDVDSLASVPFPDEDKMEHVDKLCYLGDMISAGGGAGKASRMRVK